MPRIIIENHHMEIDVSPGLNLLSHFLIHQAPIHTVCGGRAMCGCCRIQILSGEKGLSPLTDEEIRRLGRELTQQGWRLSCQTFCFRDITVHMPPGEELAGVCRDQENNTIGVANVK